MSNTPKIEGKILGFRNWRLVDGELRPLNDPSYMRSHALSLWQMEARMASMRGDDIPEMPSITDDRRGYSAWSFDANKAICRHHEHTAPDNECECGLYAWHDIDRISNDCVAGAVLGWGKTISHHDGFRAEHAEIVALAYSDDLSYGKVKQVREIAQANGIAVCDFDQLENVGSEFGTPVPKEMRPERQNDSDHLNLLATQVGGLVSVGGTFTTNSTHWHQSSGIYYTPPDPRRRTPIDVLSDFIDWTYDAPLIVGLPAYLAAAFAASALVLGVITGLVFGADAVL